MPQINLPSSNLLKKTEYYDSEENPYFPWWISDGTQKHARALILPMLRNGDYSKDVPELNKQQHHLLFVYGTLKKNKSAHSKLGKNPFLLGAGHTRLESFELWQTKEAHTYPVMMVAGKDKPTAKAVQGEVYVVDVPTLKRCDTYEQNGELYSRVRLRIRLGEPHPGREVTAWTYLGRRLAWDSEIAEKKLRLCPSFQRKKEPLFKYYTFIQAK